MKKQIILLAVVFYSLLASAQLRLARGGEGAFPLFDKHHAATIMLSEHEGITVRKVADLFADDVQRVTAVRPAVIHRPVDKHMVIIGTVGKSKIIDRLAAKHKIDVSAIRGGCERYVIQTVEKPMKGVDRALVIAGSDRRGVAYGVFSLSELIGVSPYYWWADVPVRHRSQIYISGSVVSKSPSVKYRGIFINDEDWGMKPWASNNFERDLGDIGPKTYAKVCELILRLKGNMLAPAMHSCTGAFYSHPNSKLVADSFGIVITTSHCEPLLLNNASKFDWDLQKDGDWNYATNKDAILSKWDKRLAEASSFENIYTTAMRGLHDAGLRGNMPMNERVPLIERVIADQRHMLERHKGIAAQKIPQIFVPYKETMDIYENGLRVPDDITLVWVDDNYGYMKRVSNPQEQKRSGRSGVYYHLSYLGAPHDYLWLNTTPPVLMYEELMKAYHTGADRYWLLNVGDIKPAELGIKTFFDLAWDVTAFDENTINHHQSQFLGSMFGEGYISAFQNVLSDYYRLAWSRKPEFMGWEREWDDKEHTGLKDTEFSFQHYDEAQHRLSDYQRISDRVASLLSELPNEEQPAFFEMVVYPVMASYQMNRKFLMAQLNHEQVAKGYPEQGNWAARQMELAFDSIAALNHRYNSMLHGKWNGMMSLAPGWCALYQNKPIVTKTASVGEKAVDLSCKPSSLHDCMVLDLTTFVDKHEAQGHAFHIIKGIGYDDVVLQLGQPEDAVGNAQSLVEDRIDYSLPAIQSDTIEIIVYTVPLFPLYKDRTTNIGISVDGCKPQVFNNVFKEYGLSWKDQVLRNGALKRLLFAINPQQLRHTLSFICGEPGMMIQKVIVNWGGLQPSYLGPDNRVERSL